MCSQGSLVTNTFGYTSRPGPTKYAEFLIFIAIAPTNWDLQDLQNSFIQSLDENAFNDCSHGLSNGSGSMKEWCAWARRSHFSATNLQARFGARSNLETMIETYQDVRDRSSMSLGVVLYLNLLTVTQTQECLTFLSPVIFMTAFDQMLIVNNDRMSILFVWN